MEKQSELVRMLRHLNSQAHSLRYLLPRAYRKAHPFVHRKGFDSRCADCRKAMEELEKVYGKAE